MLLPRSAQPSAITDVFAPMDGRIEVDKSVLNEMGIRVTFVPSQELLVGSSSFVIYNEVALIDELLRLRPCSYS